MALVQKLASPNPTIVTSAVRPGAGARVASHHGGAVEEVAISSDTFFDTSPYEYTDGQSHARNDDHRYDPKFKQRREHFGAINATTEIFASLLASELKGDQVDKFGNVHHQAYPSEVIRAIDIYELYSKIINGNNSILGTQINITL
jgi:hypothetical protein